MDWKHCGRRHREREKAELEQGAERFMLTEVQGKCRPHSRSTMLAEACCKVQGLRVCTFL